MGQGTSKYRKITRTPQTGENAGKKLWYATAVSDREMSFEDFVTHISEHNSPYSRGTIHGVLMDSIRGNERKSFPRIRPVWLRISEASFWMTRVQ